MHPKLQQGMLHKPLATWYLVFQGSCLAHCTSDNLKGTKRKPWNATKVFFMPLRYQNGELCMLILQPRTKPVETHYKNTYFFHSPWQKCLPSQIKRPFPPSPFAMLFAITKEMHTWAVRPKQHCNRGGEGGEFVPFDTKIAWREIENCIGMSQQFCPGL